MRDYTIQRADRSQKAQLLKGTFERNNEIIDGYLSGEKQKDLAVRFNISRQRVSQIVQNYLLRLPCCENST